MYPRFTAIVVLLVAATAAAAQETCRLETIGSAEAVAARDGRTLTLRDGRELRLAAIETPDTAQPALAALASGRTLMLKRLGSTDADRYGRVVAFAFAINATESLQQILVTHGQARVGAYVGSMACAEPLLAAERAARAEKRGLWADPNFAPLPPDHLVGFSGKMGQFMLVEGKILSVRQSGSTVYLNFARHWSRGFSVAVASRSAKTFAAAGIKLKALEGRTVRVRGWLEQRRGPLIEASAPEQIEFVN